jgi:hypothetical protein
MKSLLSKHLAVLALLLFGGNAVADHNLWLGVKAGTLGLGVEGAWRPIPWLDLRLGANQYRYKDSGSQAGINYDAELNLDNFYGTANFRFPLSPMRFSAGAYSNGNQIDMISDEATTAFNIGGTIYPADAVGTLTSTTSFETMSPYVGVGFDFDLFDKVGLSLDLGVLWQGEPAVTLESDGLLANDPLFLDALETERQQIESEFEDYKAWPVISLGFNYQFM